MLWEQTSIRLRARPRGFHLVTDEIRAAVSGISRVRMGVLHLFLQHTSASLTINENADPDVRTDLERWINQAAPDGAAYFEHTAEGDDDMPGHVKCAVFGVSVSIPVSGGRMALGTWQGVYLGEHRDHGGARTVLATLWGDEGRSP